LVKADIVERIRTHHDLRVFQLSFEAGMEIFRFSKNFPKEEKYSLTDQIRRSSRSVSGNIAEAWRKRRYQKAFIAKLSDSEGEAAETQVWLDYALACGYLNKEDYNMLFNKYDHILSMIVNMTNHPEKWTF
jgi:four helix bundle protein